MTSLKSSSFLPSTALPTSGIKFRISHFSASIIKDLEQKQCTKQRMYFDLMVLEEFIMVGKTWRLVAKLSGQDITCYTAKRREQTKWDEDKNSETLPLDMYLLG